MDSRRRELISINHDHIVLQTARIYAMFERRKYVLIFVVALGSVLVAICCVSPTFRFIMNNLDVYCYSISKWALINSISHSHSSSLVLPTGERICALPVTDVE